MTVYAAVTPAVTSQKATRGAPGMVAGARQRRDA
jgi:hypothetical protein